MCAWDAGTAVGGHTFFTFRQDPTDGSCAPACVMTVARLANNKVLEEDTLHRWFAAAEGVQSVRNVNQHGIREFTSWWSASLAPT